MKERHINIRRVSDGASRINHDAGISKTGGKTVHKTTKTVSRIVRKQRNSPRAS
jgi:hypothetical protein